MAMAAPSSSQASQQALSSEYTKAKRALLATQQAVERLETTEGSAHVPAELAAIAQDVGAKLRDLHALHGSLRRCWEAGAAQGVKATVWKQRVDQHEQAYLGLSASYEAFLHRQGARESQRRERQELLQRRGNAGAGSRGGAFAGMGKADTEQQMMRSVATSNQVIEDIFGQGSAILAGMAGQRDRLKVRERRERKKRVPDSPSHSPSLRSRRPY